MISLRKVTFALGGPPLLEEASLEIAPGERISLIGRNGAGKSTLLRLLSGELLPDSGEVYRSPDCRLAVLPQDVPSDRPGTVEALVHDALMQAAPHTADWQADIQVTRLLEQMQLPAGDCFNDLSAGKKRRALLAACCISDPDILLLDEPTNHLDIEAIAALETFLSGFRGALLFITHDRAFLRKLSTRIVDLDRGKLISWDCDYDTYLNRKDEWLEAESRQQAVFDKKLSEEEAWLRQGIKARRTRNEGRKRALLAMREQYRQRRQRTGSVRLQLEQAEQSGAKVLSADNLRFAYDHHLLVKDFNWVLERGDKIGLVGPNGVGKTTFLRLLLGQLQPNSGSITQGTALRIAYFDQMREALDDNATVRDAVADGNEVVEINGARKHVVGYLQDFLFTPDRIRGPVRNLSGGERNRLLLARLFTRPFNVLVMDEPTNDLDLETVDLLEELLADFQGTLLLVSHDRAFLNNVTTALLVFEGQGMITPVSGGYDDYLLYLQRKQDTLVQQQEQAVEKTPVRQAKARKMLNREVRELEALPLEIEQLEQEQAAITTKLADPEFLRSNAAEIAALQDRLHAIEDIVLNKFTRWEELENLRISCAN
ncbi:MAG: ATP-binding cassette domain-containing protein [Verrucomicrobia bacterium]|nr:ATP-binding cassette domain-containing protein [Verrucomicrobiota bacterium]